jgi:hypothetical protein
MKYETLKEAAEKSFGEIWASLTTEQSEYLKSYINRQIDKAKKGQAERMYTYDEMRTIAYNAYCKGQLDEPTEGKFNLWIQKSKKE